MAQYAVRYYQPKCAREGFFRRHFTTYYDELRFVTSSILLVAVFFGLFFLTLPLLHITFKNIPAPIPVPVLAQPSQSTVDHPASIATEQFSRNIQVKDPATNTYVSSSTKVEWPVRGPITLEFGAPDWPYMPVHSGLDIAAHTGTPVVPAMAGKVIYAGSIGWGYGTHIIIDHGNGIQTIYAHLSAINVTKDTTVSLGQVIGQVGQTGWATGPHLHFQVNVSDKPVNPRIFLGYN